MRKNKRDHIDARTQLILRKIVDNYIITAEPVGSRTLSKQLDMTISPATVRNIMSDLSDMGYLKQAHTSSGRVPTDKAYRVYVDELVVANQLPEKLQHHLIYHLQHKKSDQVVQLLQKTTHLLADITEFVCLITAPKIHISRLQRIEFVKVSYEKILVILITKTGVIHNKIIENPEHVSQRFLNSISSFLNEKFCDQSLQEIRENILDSMVQDKARYDDLLAQAIRLGKRAFELDHLPEIFIDGQFRLLKSERFRNTTSVMQQLMEMIHQKTALLKILDEMLLAEGIKIFIGVENEIRDLQECSFIAASYHNRNNVLGSIGVIGPTNMNYQQIIPVVDYTAKLLSQVISEQAYD